MANSSTNSLGQTRGPLIAAGVVIGLLALNWVAAVARFQVEGLYWDQWVFCWPLFQDHTGWLELFLRQHGPHRQGLAFVMTAAVMDWAQWDTRVEGLWIASWLVVAAVMGVAWKRRLTGRFDWVDLWLPLALLSLRQCETVLLVPNLSHSVFPLVLLLAMAWLLAGSMSRWRWIGWAGLGGVALFTGFGIMAWVAAGWLVLLRVVRILWIRKGQSWTGPVGAAALLALALVGFLQDYRWGLGGEGAEYPHWPLWEYPQFVVRLLVSRMDLAGGGVGANVAGWVVLVAAVVALVHASWRLLREEKPTPAWMGAVFLLGAGLAYAGFTATGRIHLGMGAADAPRYVTLIGVVWLGLAAWSAALQARGWTWAVAVLGWSSIAMSWTELPRRAWADWPGTLGMSEVTRNAIDTFNLRKMEWLMRWEESGSWQKAEEAVPAGIYGEANASWLGEQIDWLSARGLTFADPAKGPRAWLPWWNPLGVTWVKATMGEHRRWIREEAILMIDGRPGAFLNLQASGRGPGLMDGGRVEIEWGGQTTVIDASTLLKGLSWPAPTERTKLVLRSVGRAEPFGGPNGAGAVTLLMENPTLTLQPKFVVQGWVEDAEGLWPERSLEVVAGLHDWEGEGQHAWAWTLTTLTLRCRAVVPSYLNIEITARYPRVNRGLVRLRVAKVERELAWSEGGLRLAIPIPTGRTVEVALSNLAGSGSPREAGESDDDRQLALRLERLSLDAEAVWPASEP